MPDPWEPDCSLGMNGPLPGYCGHCGHELWWHAEAGICMFTCDCYRPGDFCGCDRGDLARGAQERKIDAGG